MLNINQLIHRNGRITGIIQYDPLRTVIYSSPVQRLTSAALINRQYNQCNRLVHEKHTLHLEV